MSFSDYIESHLDEIVTEWRTFARQISPMTEAMSALALDNHAREMLMAIVADMTTPQTEHERSRKAKGDAPAPSSAAPETAAYTHGVTRHLSGFDIDQVVSEFRALRATVLALWRDADTVRSKNSKAAVEEIARFNEALDQALTESVLSHSAQVNHSRDMFLAVLGHDVRGPLSAIHMASELLERPILTEAMRMQVALRLRRAATTVGRLTTDLLEYARSRSARVCQSNARNAICSTSAVTRSTQSRQRIPSKWSSPNSWAI